MINFNNTYEKLPGRFFSKETPDKLSNPTLIKFNKELACELLELDLEEYSTEELAHLFSGQIVPDSASSIALVYAGHQFGHFSSRLGDGRALLLGEILNSRNERFDIQLKGSGRTHYSRSGDGKSSLGPVIREYLVSEAMYSLGVPTTRALAAVTTGEIVYRGEELPGGILTRVAKSHIRIGTFEYFSGQEDIEAIKQLTEYSVKRHFPKMTFSNDIEFYLNFLKEVANVQAGLVSKWMSLGFIHGVMNTDNMTISGETIDYGPCAFMDNFSSSKTFSSIDRNGRYAYDNQLNIAKWNLYRLANTLLPLIDSDRSKAIVIVENSFIYIEDLYKEKYLEAFCSKFGIFKQENIDEQLIKSFLDYLESEDLDFTLSFHILGDSPNLLKQTAELKKFLLDWNDILDKQNESREQAKELMKSINPLYIPRNHQIERAIVASLSGDYSIFEELNECLKNPFQANPKYEKYSLAPHVEQRVQATFCGT